MTTGPSLDAHAYESINIAIIGSGYVGLTTAACFAHIGHRVVCADVSTARIDALNSHEIPILEAGIEILVEEGMAAGSLRFVADNLDAVRDAAVVFLCVPTPQDSDGSADLSFVMAVAEQIGPFLEPNTVVVNKSTVPVGSAKRVQELIGRPDVSVVSNPEFLREGCAIRDFLHPDRIVIGAESARAADVIEAVYAPIEAPKLHMTPESAELVKYASNGFLAMKISFANEIAQLSELVDADVSDVLGGVGKDRRIGDQFLNPGPGWGGSCFPKDTHALAFIGEKAGHSMDLVRATIETNRLHMDWVTAKLVDLLGSGSRLAVWGLAFKAGTDDVRCSPPLDILNRISPLVGDIVAYDPGVDALAHSHIRLVTDPIDAVDGADLLFVGTEWPLFGSIDLGEVAARMRRPRIFDVRRIIDPERAAAFGIEYFGIGTRRFERRSESVALSD